MKARSTCNQEVMTKVAEELGLTLTEVKAIVNAQSAYTKNLMESSSFDGVRWPYLGVFKAKPKEVQVINHLKGLTPEQQIEFKRELREGKYKRNYEIV